MEVAPEEVKEDLLFSEVCRTDVWFATCLSHSVIVVPAGGPVDFAVICPGKFPCLGLIRRHPVRSVLLKKRAPQRTHEGESRAGVNKKKDRWANHAVIGLKP